jgi:hypothetical protein
LALRFFPLGGEYSEAPSLFLALLFCPPEVDALRERDFEDVVVEGACLGINYQVLQNAFGKSTNFSRCRSLGAS